MDAARIADKYVARDGGPPRRTTGRPASREVSAATAETILTLASFVAWHDKGATWGGYTKEQAFDALCRLTGLSSTMLLRIARGELTTEPLRPGREGREDLDDIPF